MPEKIPFPFTRHELADAIVKERRGYMRKRLRAVQAVLRGASHQEAARKGKFELSSVDSWIHLAKTGGLKAVLADPHSATQPLDPGEIASRRSEIAVALETKLPRLQRRRLRGIDAFLAGQSREAAARVAGIEPGTLNGWIRIYISQGLERLIQKPKPRRPRIKPASIPAAALAKDSRPKGLPPDFILSARAEIAAALKRRLRVRLRSRLEAIDAVLAGEPLERAAALIYIKPATLKSLLGQIRKHGMACMLAKWKVVQTRQPKLDANPAVLRARAARQRDPGKRRRLIALAHIAEGLSVDDAAVLSGISDSTVRACIRRFQEGGFDGLRRMKNACRYGHTRR